jgi:hypothetical protein
MSSSKFDRFLAMFNQARVPLEALRPLFGDDMDGLTPREMVTHLCAYALLITCSHDDDERADFLFSLSGFASACAASLGELRAIDKHARDLIDERRAVLARRGGGEEPDEPMLH